MVEKFFTDEELVAYLYYGDSLGDILYKNVEITNDFKREEIAIVHKEEGPDQVKIKFSDYALKNEMYVDDLLKIIKEAKEELLK